MLQRALLILFFLLVIILIVTWLAGGALKNIVGSAGSFVNPFEVLFTGQVTPGNSFQYFPPPAMPYVTKGGTQFYNPTTTITAGGDSATYENIQDQYSELDSEYDTLAKSVSDARTFGEPSPYRGLVSFSYSNSASEANPSEEYIELNANSGNKRNILLKGWSIQSIISGMRVPIPRADIALKTNTAPVLQYVELGPGESAYVITGASPVGASFRENMCSGYLNQFNSFVPDITTNCPSPSAMLPNTADNLQYFGASCVDFVSSLPSCQLYMGPIPEGLAPQCVSLVQEMLSYNGCIDHFRFRAGFNSGVWRLYLNAPRELWNNRHDVIRLLDASGKTVDVLSY